MLDKILFWVVLVWMVALLGMAIWAVREVIKEDGRFPTDDDGTAPGSAPEEPKTSDAPATSDKAGGLKS
jgi:hypothetical protein